MPTVPGLEGPSVAQRPIGTPYANEKHFDAGPGIEQATGQFQQLAQESAQYAEARDKKARDEALAQKSREDLTQLQKEGTDAMYGTEKPTPQQAADAAFDGYDPKQGYLSMKGKDAVATGPDVTERLQKRRDQLAETYTDPDAKRFFLGQSEGLLRQYYGTVEGHSAQQREAAKVDALKDAEDQAIRRAALDPNDSIAATNDIARIVGAQDAMVTSPGNALARADAVQERITTQRLDSLLAQPGGFTEAERVLNENKRVLGKRLDDYEKRIAAAKLGGLAAVEANRIVGAAQPDESAQRLFRMPDSARVEKELADLAAKDGRLFEKVAPIARAQLAFQKEDVKQRKEAFVDQAIATYNKNHATFFSSDIADRLNKVDPNQYRVLWNETYQRAKSAGDDSPKARREQADRDKLALRKYKAYGDGNIDERISLKPESFVAGMNVSEEGLAAIEDAHAADVGAREKKLGTAQKDFVAQTRAELQGFAPAPGVTKQSRAAAKAWWEEKTANAVDAYTEWLNNNPTKKAPSHEEAAKLRAGVILDQPVRPDRLGSLQQNVRALTELAAPKGPKGGKVVVVGPDGKAWNVNSDGLDDWLASHPGWKRR